MATPNSEQLLAIEHHGGVLLRAGAGSGKTFVLKEHMIFLAKNWVKEFKINPVGDFETYIRTKFRKVVLMTFTKKAAGELEIRLNTEFDEVKENSNEDISYWESITRNLNYLTVSTIHGFCFKLIKQGFFKGVSADQEILTESEFKDQMKNIFQKWFLKETHKKSEIYEIILKDKSNVLSSIISIFSDPTLRNSWRETDTNHIHKAESDEIIKNLLNIYGFDSLFEEYFDPNEYSEFQGKKWFDFLVPFCELKRGLGQNLDSLVKMHQFFENIDYKIPVKPSLKTVPENVVEYYEKVKSIKDYLKKNGEHLFMYKTHFDSRVVPWFSMIKELIDFVEEEYKKVEGVTFSDLEYLVYQGLKDEKIAEQVAEQYEYFIIDEFQDTSFIQFSIVEKIIKSNYNKLFCVGDLKQAIYGFRGGELGVFLNCQKLIPKNLTLNNNYRSDLDIIDFNNVFFEYLFEKGMNFKGSDSNQVAVEYQNVPIGKTEKGGINCLGVDLAFRTSEEKISNAEVDYIEALAIFEQIKAFHESGEESAILYKRLKPSLILIDLMIQNDIGFTAQIKIPFLEDPVIGLFYLLIENKFNKNENNESYLSYSLQAYFSLIGSIHSKSLSEDDIKRFYSESLYFGYYHAFCNFLNLNGIKNSNYKNNLEQIITLLDSSYGNDERLFKLLQAQRDLSYSLDFQYGENSKQIKIMTAHASKGLQFKNVFLGGMYTNENSLIFKSSIGKFPLSFKWSESIHGKKKYKTPLYMFEEELTKNKEFSESKRLFYVANTRAESTLSYVDIDFESHKRMKSQAGSWINGINLWRAEKLNFERINDVKFDISDQFDNKTLEKVDFRPPLFHTDSLGIECIEEISSISFLPELSITKFATITQCPKKFYFESICKFTAEEMALFENPELLVQTSVPSEELNSSNIKASNSERGSYIHEAISEQVLTEFSTIFEHSDKKIENSVNWAVENLKPFLDNYKLISEKPIKFELLNYMVSGIPDLIIQPLNTSDSCEVWDFKTGRFSEDKLRPYDFQLMSYAYSQFELGKVKSDKLIKTVLCFVDEKKLVEKTVSKADVDNFLSLALTDIKDPSTENLSECEYCKYKYICQK